MVNKFAKESGFVFRFSWKHVVSLAIENNIEIIIFLFHLQQYLINMFYEILNLRAPNVSNFAEALKVADPSTFKDSWKLADGFVAAEGMFKI